ncbi:hypothetical protein Hanom_Chr15g01351281 [Helianthus anomalus]
MEALITLSFLTLPTNLELVLRNPKECVATISSGVPTQGCLPGTGLIPRKTGTGVAESRRSTCIY